MGSDLADEEVAVIELIIPGRCVPKGRPRATFQGGKVITYTPANTRDYEEMARMVVLSTCNKEGVEPIPFPTPVKITIEFILKKKPKDMRPDILNLAMTVSDLLQGNKKRKIRSLLYDDDSQLVEVHLFKRYGEYPMTRVVVEEFKK